MTYQEAFNYGQEICRNHPTTSWLFKQGMAIMEWAYRKIKKQ